MAQPSWKWVWGGTAVICTLLLVRTQFAHAPSNNGKHSHVNAITVIEVIVDPGHHIALSKPSRSAGW
jgi:hypothetical protein